MQPLEFLMLERPVSLQAKSRRHLQAWKGRLHDAAEKIWRGGVLPLSAPSLCCTIVYFYSETGKPVDIDNIIKPILDAFVDVVYINDALVSDVDCHRRPLAEFMTTPEVRHLLLRDELIDTDCVYIRICNARDLRSYL